MRINWRGKRVRSVGHSGGEYLWTTAGLGSNDPHIRVTQLVVETAEVGATNVRVTQLPVEAVEVGLTNLRVTQIVVEYIYPFRCNEAPPIVAKPGCPEGLDSGPATGRSGCDATFRTT